MEPLAREAAAGGLRAVGSRCVAVFGPAILTSFLPAARPAHAQTVDGIEQAWRTWMAGHGRKTGGLAVVHGGLAVREAAMGQEAVGAPVPVASLSKAVTAVCVAGLIERGRLSFETPLSQALARTMMRVGQPVDPRLSAVTISQLLVHRAGLAQGRTSANAPLAGYLRTHTARRTAFDVQLGCDLSSPAASSRAHATSIRTPAT